MIVAGVDVGALSTDTVILDGDNEILAYSIVNTGASSQRAARRSYAQALALAGLAEDAVSYVISTGYGWQMVPFADVQVTEITCHARGAHFLFPETHTVIDIGGQDSKVIKVSPLGRVKEQVTMSGGVAKNIGVVKAIEEKLGTRLNIYQEPQIVGVLGAALIALEKI